MAEVKGLFDDFGMIGRFVAYNKKSCCKTIAAQHVKHIIGQRRVGTVVEGQAEFFDFPRFATVNPSEKIAADADNAPYKKREQRYYHYRDARAQCREQKERRAQECAHAKPGFKWGH